MKFKDYRKWRPTYSQYESDYSGTKYSDSWYYGETSITGLAAEAGELLALVQKSRRKQEHIDREKVVDELGDVLWYMCYVMDAFDISMDELTDYNYNKLTERNKE